MKRESLLYRLRNRPSVGRRWNQPMDLENRKTGGAPSRQVTEFDAPSVVRGETEKYYNESKGVIPSYS